MDGKLEATMLWTYGKIKQSIQSMDGHSNTKVSVGNRIQANNDDEVIVVQQNHNVDLLPGGSVKHTFGIEAHCFSKSYTEAAKMSDKVFGAFHQQQYISGNTDTHSFPTSQDMYYTDQDDFAAITLVNIVVVQENV